MTCLVVSPHLDDAVLSIGGSIARWVAGGERVVIASVYTTGPALETLAPSMRKFADYARRRAEDDAACAGLGAEVRRLEQTERAFRPPYLTGWSFFTTPPARDGFAALPEVTAALEPLAALDPARILVPLGIGNHVDHVEALLAATDWAIARGWRDRLRFYEDFYALSRTMRAEHPIARQRMWRRRRSPLVRSRQLARILRMIAEARGGPDVTALLDPALRDATWTVKASPIDERAKLAAIAAYPSQTAAFGGLDGIARAVRAYDAWWGGEPLWRAN